MAKCPYCNKHINALEQSRVEVSAPIHQFPVDDGDYCPPIPLVEFNSWFCDPTCLINHIKKQVKEQKKIKKYCQHLARRARKRKMDNTIIEARREFYDYDKPCT